MRKNIALASFVFGLAALFSFGLCLLLYFLGEPERVDLGRDASEFVSRYPELLRLGYLIEVSDGGNYSVFIDGSRHDFYLFSVSERVGNALKAALSFDYGQAKMAPKAVWDLLWPGLALFALMAPLNALFCLGASRKKPKAGNPVLYFLLAGACLILALTLGLCLPVGAGVCSLALCCFASIPLSLGVTMVNRKLTWLSRGMLLAGAMTFIGFFVTMAANDAHSLSRTLLNAIVSGDSHVYAVGLFFVLIILALPLSLALLGKKRKASGVPA